MNDSIPPVSGNLPTIGLSISKQKANISLSTEGGTRWEQGGSFSSSGQERQLRSLTTLISLTDEITELTD